MFSRLRAKKDPPRERQEPRSGGGPEAAPSLPTVLLFLKEPISIDQGRLFNTLCDRYKAADGTEPLVSIKGPLVSVAGVVVAIVALSSPVPDGWRELAAPARNPHWPNGLEVCASHRAHMIISVMDKQTDLSRAVRVLTAVAGAITALHPEQVLAGLWSAKVLNSGEEWAKLSTLSFAPYPGLPTGLWVSQLLFSDEETEGVGVLTQGLAWFVGRELELTAHGVDLKLLLERASGLIVYLVHNGPVLKDGSTFGISETERIAVALRVSSRFPGLPVIAASLE